MSDTEGTGLSPLAREALGHIVTLTSGTASREEVEAIKAWSARSAAHEAAFREAAALWDLLGNADPAALPADPAAAPFPDAERLSRRSFLGRAGLTAGVAGLAASGAFLAFGPSLEELLADHRTGVGERRAVTLSDGSRVELNTGSALSVDFSEQHRKVRLIAGEAIFSVVPDAARPFTVATGTGTTTAVGTVFAIRNRDASVSVTCVEGEIQVSPASRESRHARLLPGKQVSYAGRTLGRVDDADLERQLAWRKGLLIFAKEPLENVVAEINRYRFGQIVLLNEQARHRKVSGVFHLDRTDEALRDIGHAFDLSVLSLTGGIAFIY